MDVRYDCPRFVEDADGQAWVLVYTHILEDGTIISPPEEELEGCTPKAPARERTPEEQRILDLVAADRGREYAERWAERILEQARAIGDL